MLRLRLALDAFATPVGVGCDDSAMRSRKNLPISLWSEESTSGTYGGSWTLAGVAQNFTWDIASSKMV
eukprot:1569762-Pleurochrysis_carterae.AAC.5